MTAAVMSAPFSFTPASMAPPTPATSVVVKLSLRGETFRITYAPSELTWEAICAKVRDCYDDAHRPSEWTLVYRDNEDDLVTVSNALEFVEAYRVFAELKEQPAHQQKLHMHFHVVARLSLKEQLAPAMQAVVELSERVTRLAAETRDSLRKSSYVERGRESIYVSAVNTRVALSSAGRGLSQRVRHASTVVVGEISEIRRRARTRSRGVSRDIDDESSPRALFATNMDEQSEETPEMTNVADLLAQARAEEEEAERLAMEEAERTPETAPEAQIELTTEEVVPEVETRAAREATQEEQDDDADEEERHASDAETCSTASEDTACEWDFVPAASSLSLSTHMEVDADDEVEASFSRWESQLKTIRDIMPQLDTAFCIDILDKHQGNLEATLVELTEL